MKILKKPIYLFVLFYIITGNTVASTVKCDADANSIQIKVIKLVLQKTIDTTKIDTYLEQCGSNIDSLTQTKKNHLKNDINKSITIIEKEITSLSKQYINTSDAALVTKKNKLEPLITRLSIIGSMLQSASSLDVGWGADFRSNFYMGFEGTSVEDIKNKITVRTGFMAYNQITELKHENGNKWDTSLNYHVFGNVLLTSSGEDSSLTTNQEVERATRIDLNHYFPLFTKNQSNGLFAIGPIVSQGLRKSNNDGDFTRLRYWGLRFAHSVESYFDVMEGGSSTTSKRLLMRGQVPVAEAFSGKIFVGGELNIASQSTSVGSDTFSFYVTWQVSFNDVFGE